MDGSGWEMDSKGQSESLSKLRRRRFIIFSKWGRHKIIHLEINFHQIYYRPPMDRAEKRTTETDGKRLSFLFLCCISLPSFPDRTISTAAARKHLHSITINSPLTFVSWKTTERRVKATTAGCTLILMQRLPSEGTPTWNAAEAAGRPIRLNNNLQKSTGKIHISSLKNNRETCLFHWALLNQTRRSGGTLNAPVEP